MKLYRKKPAGWFFAALLLVAAVSLTGCAPVPTAVPVSQATEVPSPVASGSAATAPVATAPVATASIVTTPVATDMPVATAGPTASVPAGTTTAATAIVVSTNPPAATAAATPGASVTPASTGVAGQPVLTWHREGGIAGFCDDLVVYSAGLAVVSTCKGNSPQELRRFQLTPAQTAQLQTWVSTLQGFNISQTDPAQADALTTRLLFAGIGSAAPTEAERQAIQAFAAALVAAAST